MHVPAIESYLKRNLVDRGNDQSRYKRSLELEPREQYVSFTYSDQSVPKRISPKCLETTDSCKLCLENFDY